ncbi:MAG TPA: hypothetical protein VF516_37955 [Kofleriaceae bacterium]
MVKHAVRYMWFSALAFAAGCSPAHSDSISAVTIEVTCGSTADCPSGFECNADIEHGPPTALCESQDPSATCPSGYETKVMYGQIFCKPPAPVAAGARAGRTSAHRHTAGL